MPLLCFQRPRSACNNNCQPGYRKGILQGKPSCCYDCIRCAEGQYSNHTGMNTSLELIGSNPTVETGKNVLGDLIVITEN